MEKIFVHGMGRLGSQIIALAKASGYACTATASLGSPFVSIEADFDVAIDCTSADAVYDIVEYCRLQKKPLLVCTTGMDEHTLQHISSSAKEIAILCSSNVSLGANLAAKLSAIAAKILFEHGFDAEIVESHHNRKKDAPSGTAFMLADAVNSAADEVFGHSFSFRISREKTSGERPKAEIGIHSIRGGNIIGEHEVIFAGEDEIIRIKHQAANRNLFAKGALVAAKFLINKPAGLYTMDDVMSKLTDKM